MCTDGDFVSWQLFGMENVIYDEISTGIFMVLYCLAGGQTKRRRSSVRSRSSSLEDNVIVYGTELTVYGKQYQCMLKSGTYDLILQEVGSKFSTQDCQWEKAGGKRV